MPNRCETCGNEYENLFELRFKRDGVTHYFDSFECAIHAVAPKCSHCGVAIVGHGVQSGAKMFCCAHCARGAGIQEIVDRVQRH
jgi:hypothetical protein